jgi:hypothetical protein
MGKYQPFSFQGCGYVQDIELADNAAKINIQVVQIHPNDCADTVNLECTMLPALQEKIRQLNLRCPYTSGVMVWFEAVFNKVGACFSDMDSTTDQQIILLKGELEAIRAWKHDASAICSL